MVAMWGGAAHTECTCIGILKLQPDFKKANRKRSFVLTPEGNVRKVPKAILDKHEERGKGGNWHHAIRGDKDISDAEGLLVEPTQMRRKAKESEEELGTHKQVKKTQAQRQARPHVG